MKIRIMSDLHGVIPHLRGDHLKDEVLILAGDICEIKDIEHYERMLRHFGELFKTVVIVEGNHEFYENRITKAIYQISSLVQKLNKEGIKIRLLRAGSYSLDLGVSSQGKRVKVIGDTFWTNFNYDVGSRMIFSRISDSTQIRFFYDNLEFWQVQQMREKAEADLSYYMKSRTEDDYIIFVTHFPPFKESTHEDYKDHPLNDYFIGETRIPKEFYPDLWIHGHVHNSFDYVKDGCRVICNPLGYTLRNGEFENQSFDVDKAIEI